jgi:hypothetical protein
MQLNTKRFVLHVYVRPVPHDNDGHRRAFLSYPLTNGKAYIFGFYRLTGAMLLFKGGR